MSTAPWFHLAALPDIGAAVHLAREQAQHATNARRLSAGDVVTLFDGRGGVASGRLAGARGRDGSLAVEIVARRHVPAPTTEVIIATAIPKGDHWSTLLDMSAQLGASAIVPIDCERSVVHAASINRSRADRILLEACKQSRRPWIPRLEPGSTPAAVARGAVERGAAVRGEVQRGACVVIAHPTGQAASTLLRHSLPASPTAEIGNPRLAPSPPAAQMPSTIVILIGPEGGFTEAEVDSACAAGATAISLGDAILRVETAVVAVLTLCRLP